MPQAYRKLNKAEVLHYGRLLSALGRPERELVALKKYLKDFYPPEAAIVVVSFNSDYDDEYYSYKVAFLTVTDAKGKELNPLEGKSKEARKAALSLPLGREDSPNDQSDEDEVYIVGETKLPDLYILKEAE